MGLPIGWGKMFFGQFVFDVDSVTCVIYYFHSYVAVPPPNLPTTSYLVRGGGQRLGVKM